jgi:O-antigen/teichoic acid export membrane protein
VARVRRFFPDLAAVALFLVLPLILFWPVTVGGRTLLPADNLYQYQPFAADRAALGVPEVAHNMLLSDLVLENMVWKQFIRQRLSAGELPLWNPYLFSGVPFLAAGQHSGLYPFSVPYYIMPLEYAYGWYTLSQIWLAGILMYVFLRGIGVGRVGAVIGGVAYQLSGFFLASVVFQMVIGAAAWLPLLVLMTEYTLRDQPLWGRPARWVWAGIGALAFGVMITAGHAEFVYYSALVMGFWAACRLTGLLVSRRESLFRLLRTGAALLAMVIMGFGVGAVQFIPFLELANSSFREGRATFDQVRGYAFPPRHALTFLMPNIYGNPAQHDYYDVFTGQTVPLRWTRPDGYTVTDTFQPGGKNYVEGAAYVGILTLLLAGIGVLGGAGGRTGPYRVILVALSLISLSFAFGTITYAVLYYGLPGIRQLHSPFRWVFPLTLCLAALAGFGTDALIRAGREAGFVQRLARLIGAGGVVMGVLVAAVLILARLRYDAFSGVMQSLYDTLAGANLAYPSPDVLFSVKVREVGLFAAFLTASGAAILLGTWRRAARWWPVLPVGVLAADLLIASWGFNPAADPAWLRHTPASVAWLQAQNPHEWRLTTLTGPTNTLNANTAWWFGLQDIRGYDSIIMRDYVEYMGRIAPQDQLLYNRIAPIFPHTIDGLDSRWLDLLSVRYIMAEVEIDTGRFPHLKQVYRDAAVRIYENTRAFPRAFVIQDDGPAPMNPDGTPLIRLMDGAQAEITQAGGVQVTVRADVPDLDAALILTDAFASGWRAYIRRAGDPESAEQEVGITPYMGLFRKVALGAGQWEVRFRYSPPAVQVGAFATFLSLAALAFGGMVWAWGALFRGAGEGSGVRRLAKNSLAPIALNLFNRLIDLAFAVIMLRLLGPANAGVYYYAVVIFGWFDILTNFGLNTWLTREVARDRAGAGRYLLNSSLLRLGLAGAGIPLLIGFLAVRSGLQPPLENTAIGAILLLYIGLIPNSISTGLTALLYAFEKAEIPAAVSTVTVILKSVAGLAVLLAGWGVIGLAGVSIALNAITLIMLYVAARRAAPLVAGRQLSGTIRPDSGLMRAMLSGGFPLMLNHLLATVFFKIDVVLLEPLQGPEVVGTYSTAYKWVDALGVVPSLFTMALLPVMARLAVENRDEMRRAYGFAVKLLFSLALPTAIATTFLAEFLITVLGGPRFLPDGAIALALMIWFIPIGWINSLTNYVLVALDQQKRMRWAFLAGVGFNITTNLIFIPLYSYRASAVVTIFSELVLLIGFGLLLRASLGGVNYLSLVGRFVLAGGGMAGVMWVLWPVAPLIALVAGGAAYGGVLLALRPFTAWEQSRIAALVRGRAG